MIRPDIVHQKQRIPFLLFATLLLLFCCCQTEQLTNEQIENQIRLACEWSENDFLSPPNSAKVQVWYHWMNGHVSEKQITEDLQAMKEAGIGGFTLFNTGEGTSVGSAPFYSDQWWKAFIHTKKEAKRLGLEVGIMNGPGWSASGGPWNTPENAMKEVVWTEKIVKGPVVFNERLTIPKPVLGLERDMKKDSVINRRYYMPRSLLKGFYHDIAVLAFPTPKGELNGKPYQIEAWWEKAGYSKPEKYIRDERIAPDDEVVKLNEIIDLTDKLDQSGNLNWEVPDGNWTILRIGYQPTGRSNHPAPEGGKGLEADKMSAKAVDIHWRESVMIMVDAGEEKDTAKAISFVLIDSFEAGHQNWTEGFERQFNSMAGYNIRKYLPAITSRVIGNTDTTERFLWDFRKVISDLIIENYYKRFQTLAHENGLSFAAEHYGNFGNTDDFSAGRYVDMSATEFWANQPDGLGGITKLSSSTAHIYGRKIVGAEAFTGSPGKIFETNPRDIKAQGDWYLCKGINQFWLHGFTLSPYKQEPGLLLGSYGSNFNQHNTWWKFANGWFDYLARCQYMLQQGNPQSDILYYVGEDAPVDPVSEKKLNPAIPFGYDFDFCNTDILRKIKFKDGKLQIPNGPEYEMLVIQKSDHIRIEVLDLLKKLAEAGAIIVADKPSRTPGLGSEISDEKLNKTTDELWEKSNIYRGNAVKEAIKYKHILPDIEFSIDRPEQSENLLLPATDIEFIHRQTAQTDIYFISNQLKQERVLKAVFRIKGKLPELWDPVNGQIQAAPEYKTTADGRIELTLNMEAAGSVFVVFQKNLINTFSSPMPDVVSVEPLTFSKPWLVSFEGSKAPEQIELNKLIDLAQHADKEISFFSGSINYQNHFAFEQFNEKSSVILDLGQVEVAAEVFINEKSAGTLWKMPYRVDISNLLKEGSNTIRVEVANLWVNRLIGDQQLPEDCEWTSNTGSTARGMGLTKIPDWVIEGKESPTGHGAFVGWQWEHFKNKKVMPSGLIGPLSIITKTKNK